MAKEITQALPEKVKVRRPGRPKIMGENANEDMEFVPTQPTCGRDLMAIWDLPPAAWEGCSVKINRKIVGTHKQSLVSEVAVCDFNIGSIAGQFGPGTYQVVLLPVIGQSWKMRNAMVTISPEFAAKNGYANFQTEPAPQRVSEVNALLTAANAMKQGQAMNPMDLAQLVETVSERTASTLANQLAPILKQLTPMQNQQSQGMGIDSMMTFLARMDEMQDRRMDRYLRVAGMKPINQEDEPEEPWYKEVVREAVPILGDLVSMLAGRSGNQEPGQVEPEHVQQPQQVAPQAAKPPEPKIQVPLTEEEMRKFSTSAGMLRRYVPEIIEALRVGKNVKKTGEELSKYVPSIFSGDLKALAKLTQERGPNVLAIISPHLANDVGAQLLVCIAEML